MGANYNAHNEWQTNLRLQLHSDRQTSTAKPGPASPLGALGSPGVIGTPDEGDKKGWGEAKNRFPSLKEKFKVKEPTAKRPKARRPVMERPTAVELLTNKGNTNNIHTIAETAKKKKQEFLHAAPHDDWPPTNEVQIDDFLSTQDLDMDTVGNYSHKEAWTKEMDTIFDRMSDTNGEDFVRQALLLEPTQRSREDLNILARFLMSFKIFSSVTMEKASEMARYVGLRELPANSTVYSQGSQDLGVYIILGGEVEVIVDGIRFRDLGSGQDFGNQTFLEGRTHSVRTTLPTTLLCCEGDVFAKVMRLLMTEQIQEIIDWLYTNVFFCKHWRRHKVLELANQCTQESYCHGEFLCHQDYPASHTFFVKSGECAVLKVLKRNHKNRWPGGYDVCTKHHLMKLGELRSGDFFGENTSHAADLHLKEDTHWGAVMNVVSSKYKKGFYLGSLRVTSKTFTCLAVPNEKLRRLIRGLQAMEIRRHNAHFHLSEEALLALYDESMKKKKHNMALKNMALPGKYLSRVRTQREAKKVKEVAARRPAPPPRKPELDHIPRGSQLPLLPSSAPDSPSQGSMLEKGKPVDLAKAALKCAQHQKYNASMRRMAKEVDQNNNPYIARFSALAKSSASRLHANKTKSARLAESSNKKTGLRKRRPQHLTALERKVHHASNVHHSVGTSFFF